jgi:hypothetical protein
MKLLNGVFAVMFLVLAFVMLFFAFTGTGYMLLAFAIAAGFFLLATVFALTVLEVI